MNERRTSGRGGRRRQVRSITLISWRNIPAQLTARDRGGQHKLLLHARFQHAIDRAAGVAGLTATDDYVEQWHSASLSVEEGDIEAQLDRHAAALEAGYPRDRLEALVESGGLDENREDSPESAP